MSNPTATADTPLKPSDALELVALVMERWPSLKLDIDQQRRFAQDLDGLGEAAANAAVESIHRSGQKWAPGSGEVRREAARLELGPPDWAEVKRSLIERGRMLAEYVPEPWVCPYGECDGDGYSQPNPEVRVVHDCRCRPDRRAARRLAETLDPLVREFIGSGYVTWREVDKLGAGLADHDSLTLEAQMRKKWETYAARAIESRAIASIEGAAPLARLEQARDEDGPRRRPGRGQLAQPDFRAALPERAA